MTSAIILTVLFFTAIGISMLTTELSILILGWYLSMSVVSFIVYAIDKSAAIKRAQRISESNLHLLDLLGGWPGALIAQQTYRHKTQKQSFRIIFWITILANIGGLGWLHTNDGRARLNQLDSLFFHLINHYSLGLPTIS